MSNNGGAKELIIKAWREENDKSTEGLSPRDLGFHVGLKAGLTKALNLINEYEKNNNNNNNNPINPYIGL